MYRRQNDTVDLIDKTISHAEGRGRGSRREYIEFVESVERYLERGEGNDL